MTFNVSLREGKTSWVPNERFHRVGLFILEKIRLQAESEIYKIMREMYQVKG